MERRRGKRFAELVRKSREKLGKTQRELATELKVTPAFVSLIETRRVGISLPRARQLAKVLQNDGIVTAAMRLQRNKGLVDDTLIERIADEEARAPLAARMLSLASHVQAAFGALQPANIQNLETLFRLEMFKALREERVGDPQRLEKSIASCDTFLRDRPQWQPDGAAYSTPFQIYWDLHNDANIPVERLASAVQVFERTTKDVLSSLEALLATARPRSQQPRDSAGPTSFQANVSVWVHVPADLAGKSWDKLDTDSGITPLAALALPQSFLGSRRPFGVLLPDESMAPGFPQGTVLFVVPTEKPPVGACALIEVAGEEAPLFRRVYPGNSEAEIRLRADNPDFPETVVAISHLVQSATVIGTLRMNRQPKEDPPIREDDACAEYAECL